MNWPKLAKNLILADGRISELESEIIRDAVLADGIVDKQEVEFLLSLKRDAVTVHSLFDDLLFQVFKRVVLINGFISDDEARWLRKMIFSDNQCTSRETKFIQSLKGECTSYGNEFAILYRDCTQLHASEFRD